MEGIIKNQKTIIESIVCKTGWKFEYCISFLYLIIGCSWVLLSDQTTHIFISDSGLLKQVQTYKALFFVVATAYLLFLITKKRLDRLREAQVIAENNEKLKTAFLQNISHELRTPMNAIIGFSEVVRFENTDPQLAESLEIIHNCSHQLLDVVNDVLDVSMIESGNMIIHQDEVSLKVFMERIIVSYQKSTSDRVNLKLNYIPDDDNQVVVTDEIKLKRIIVNLLSNAIKFTEKGEIVLGCRLTSANLEFYVRDTGIGIATHEQAHIFKRFSKGTVNINKTYSGTGLGLAISKRLVTLLEGEIGLKSEPGKGSTFFFSIPNRS